MHLKQELEESEGFLDKVFDFFIRLGSIYAAALLIWAISVAAFDI